MSSTEIKLHPLAVEAIARRVAELLARGAVKSGPELIDAAELARRLGMERDWVYAHASELGAVRMGAGSKPRLRFDPEVAIERMGSTLAGEQHECQGRPTRRRRRRPRSGSVQLLPIKGDRTN